MLAYVLRRLLWSAASLWLMSLLVFAGVHAVGDPVALLISPQADQAEIARATALLGLDQPLWRQYLLFFRGALSGDLGLSFVASVPAIDLILERLPATLELALAAMLIAAGLGIPLGLYAGWRPRSFGARAVMVLSTLGFALPTFWVGLVLILVFAVQLGVLPSSGRGTTVDVAGIGWSLFTADGLRHLLLPALTLALFKLGLLIQDYIRLARAKGLAEAAVLRNHVLPNILIPVLTVAALEFGSLIAFAIVTETVFAWPGMGKLLIDSIGLLDRPVIVAYLLVTITLFIVINLIADLLHALLDPRVRLQAGR
jgi:peptide/nickel transport system permease protein